MVSVSLKLVLPLYSVILPLLPTHLLLDFAVADVVAVLLLFLVLLLVLFLLLLLLLTVVLVLVPAERCWWCWLVVCLSG